MPLDAGGGNTLAGSSRGHVQLGPEGGDALAGSTKIDKTRTDSVGGTITAKSRGRGFTAPYAYLSRREAKGGHMAVNSGYGRSCDDLDGGAVFSPVLDSDVVGGNSTRARRRAIRGGSSGESLSSRLAAWKMRCSSCLWSSEKGA